MGYAWKPDYVLNMPARMFFAMRKAMLELKDLEHNKFYYEMCRVSVCASAQTDYIEAMEKYYYEKINPGSKRFNPNSFDINTDRGSQMANAKLSSMLSRGL